MGINLISFCQNLFDRLNESLFHLPDGNFFARSAVGVGHIKYMTQLIRRIRIDQQRNAFGIAINPTAMLIPPADFGAGCRIRLLCKNQQLLLKRIFEIIGRSGQEVHIVIRIHCQSPQMFRLHLRDHLILARHLAHLHHQSELSLQQESAALLKAKNTAVLSGHLIFSSPVHSNERLLHSLLPDLLRSSIRSGHCK